MGVISSCRILNCLANTILKTTPVCILTPLYVSKRLWSLQPNPTAERRADTEESALSWRETEHRYAVKDFEHLATDKVKKERIRLLLRQHKLLLRHKKPAPVNLSTEDVLSLLDQPSLKKRYRLFRYLFYKEEKKRKQIRKAEDESGPAFANAPIDPEESIRRLHRVPYTADACDKYGLFNNTILIRITDMRMRIYYESLQIPVIQFGQKLVFDLDYDHHMTLRESNKAAVDLKAAYGLNRRSRDPFHLYFCNANPSNSTIQIMNETLFDIRKHAVLTEVTEKSYLDLFPRKNLVYLSPDGDETLDMFDHDAVYIIGAFVDKGTKEGVTCAKARKEGIRTVRFPHTFTLPWEAEKTRPLHMPDVLKVLLQLKCTGDWTSALHHVSKHLIIGKE
ncbi:tRNA methyltransferase 10 homolog C-like [Ornithodoros turicata]|uniref:tRNA methyltransferase 10 homolog C-like n=1 Tax=Ornithodoros turicata TaxID=34597 RepID=UPI0031386B7A